MLSFVQYACPYILWFCHSLIQWIPSVYYREAGEAPRRVLLVVGTVEPFGDQAPWLDQQPQLAGLHFVVPRSWRWRHIRPSRRYGGCVPYLLRHCWALSHGYDELHHTVLVMCLRYIDGQHLRLLVFRCLLFTHLGKAWHSRCSYSCLFPPGLQMRVCNRLAVPEVLLRFWCSSFVSSEESCVWLNSYWILCWF